MYYCYHCGQPNEVKPAFCPNCGTPLGSEVPPAEIPAELTVAPSKPVAGRHWPAVLAMVLIFTSGVLLFFLSRLFPSATLASPTDSGPTGCFTIEDGKLYFHQENYSGGSSLTVPDTVDGQAVTALGNRAFYDCDDLTEIILPEGLLTIGEAAFAECDSLRGIYVPEAVHRIGAYAFENCSELEAISIPASVITIGSDAFSGCEDLRYIFYDGTIDAWDGLYSGFINNDILIHGNDGDWYYSKP